MDQKFDGVKIDGVLWLDEGLDWVPLCPKHHMRMQLFYNDHDFSYVECQECKDHYELPREFNAQKEYIANKLEAKKLKKLKYINIDGEHIAVVSDKVKTSDEKYFVKAIITESKTGPGIVIYAGETGGQKMQAFIDPNTKKLSFDPNDKHPSKIFVKIEAEFDDGQKHSIKK